MAIELESGFEIICFSDSAYEEMTVEIQYKGEQIAQINQDRGSDQLEMEILTEYVSSDFLPKFMLNDFLTALSEAQKLLKPC
jgi:hypothetical protein